MKPEILNELFKMQDEWRRGGHHPTLTDLAERLKEMGVVVAPSDLPALIPALLPGFGPESGRYNVPQVLLQSLSSILGGRSAHIVCDPWAGLGIIVASVQDATKAGKAFALTQNQGEMALGKLLAGNAEWLLGDSIQMLSQMTEEFDVMASVLPFNHRLGRPITMPTLSGENIELRDDLGQMILVAACQKLSAEGVGLFVVTPSFFFSQRSALHHFGVLGLGIEAALALPSGAFAPYANIPAYLVVVRKRPTSRMFVAQLSGEANTNLQIYANLKAGKEGGTLELGRFVDPLGFTGLDSLRLAERLEQAERQFGAPPVRLEELAIAINLGRQGEGFEFPRHDNVIYVPLIGNSDVVDSLDDLSLKRQNYAQVAVDPARSMARFVARFLNSELGKEIRGSYKSGIIPKLNKQTLKELRIFVPDLLTQKAVLETESHIDTEQNTLLSLQNELGLLRRQLWSYPRSSQGVDQRLRALSNQLSGSLKKYAAEGLDQWFEALPFPLASILRAWQATSAQDFKTKCEHLLHFFEATSEFISMILLSAFSSNEALFELHKDKIMEALRKQNLSFQRASFGTWKVVVEYLSSQTRQLLSGDRKKDDAAKNDRMICAELFADSSLTLPEALGRKELATILSTTNKMRNDWSGHGGVVGQEEARRRNEQLVSELQKLREVMADMWTETQLIHALQCWPREEVYENEVTVLMGSNSAFLKETRRLSTGLIVGRLYLSQKESGQALKLLDLVQVSSSPESAINACYFFNRMDKEGLRFVSYHFLDKPERKTSFEEYISTPLRLLLEIK